MKQESERGKEK